MVQPNAIRLKKLQELIHSLSCDCLIIEHPINIFYLTGLDLSKGKLFISENSSALIVDGRYIESCREQTLYPVYLQEEHSLKDWLLDQNLSKVGFDSDETSYNHFLELSQAVEEVNKKQPCQLIPLSSPIQTLRLIKDELEIQIMSEAARLAQNGYQLVKSLLSEKISESELAVELEYFWKKQGAKKLSFDPIIAFGPNSSKPHYRAGSTLLEKNTHVLIDIGVTWKHYQSDMTRVCFFGEPHPKIKEIYSIVEEAKQQTMEKCKPGTLIGELDQTARSIIDKKGYGKHFIHSLGHGIGLETHESPILRSKGPWAETELKVGMVITIEPGIYLPGIGGIRLEDTLLITENGYKNLTLD